MVAEEEAFAWRHGRWDAERWLACRAAALERGRCHDVAALTQAVQSSTTEALRAGRYEAASGRLVRLAAGLEHSADCQWFANTSIIPFEEPALAEGGAPPLIVTEMAALDAAEHVAAVLAAGAEAEASKVEVAVTVEAAAFDGEGGLRCEAVPAAAAAQAAAALRTDLCRAAKVAAWQVRGGRCPSVQHHLSAVEDPYVLVCPDVTLFRGSRDDGFPFLDVPYHIHALVTALPTQRPVLGGGRGELTHEWYAAEEDELAMLERFCLLGFAALQHARRDPAARLVLVLDALGCAQGGRHPRASLANVLAHWRRRFAGFFHCVVLACGPGAAGQQLATYVDGVVNKDVYAALLSKDEAVFRSWHWDHVLVHMHINGIDFAHLGDLCRRTVGQDRGVVTRDTSGSMVSVGSLQFMTDMVTDALKDRRSMEAGATGVEARGLEEDVAAVLQMRAAERQGPEAASRAGSTLSMLSGAASLGPRASMRCSRSSRLSRLSVLLGGGGSSAPEGRRASAPVCCGAARSMRSSVTFGDISEMRHEFSVTDVGGDEAYEGADVEAAASAGALLRRYGRRRSSASAAMAATETAESRRRDFRLQLQSPRPSVCSSSGAALAAATGERGGGQRLRTIRAKSSAAATAAAGLCPLASRHTSQDELALQSELARLATSVREQLAQRRPSWAPAQPPPPLAAASALQLPTLMCQERPGIKSLAASVAMERSAQQQQLQRRQSAAEREGLTEVLLKLPPWRQRGFGQAPASARLPSPQPPAAVAPNSAR